MGRFLGKSPHPPGPTTQANSGARASVRLGRPLSLGTPATIQADARRHALRVPGSVELGICAAWRELRPGASMRSRGAGIATQSGAHAEAHAREARGL